MLTYTPVYASSTPRSSTPATLLAYYCELDLALTYALRRPALARACLRTAHRVAVRLNRPDLAYHAATLMGLV